MMNISTVLATAAEHADKVVSASEHVRMEKTETLLEFLMMGAVTVFGTLSLLALLGVVGGKFFVWLENRIGDVDDPKARADERARRKAEQEEQERVIAAICAAVAEVVGQPHRVVSFEPSGQSAWSLEGRTQHHSSHKLR